LANAIAIAMEDRLLGADYYRQVPAEPIPGGSVVVKQAYKKNPPAVTTLLDLVVKLKPRNLVLVSHGEGSGIGLSLVPNANSALVSPHLGTLLESAGKVTQELADELEISLAGLKKLQGLIKKVRALKLGRVDFRACTLGEFPEELERMQAFFGAGAVSAPKKLDFFAVGIPRASADAAVWKKFLEENPFSRVDGDPKDRVAFEFHGDQTHMLVESKAALGKWTKKFFPGSRYKSGRVLVHGFFDADKMIYPGDAAYAANLGQFP
jgi:hypothetical protein